MITFEYEITPMDGW